MRDYCNCYLDVFIVDLRLPAPTLLGPGACLSPCNKGFVARMIVSAGFLYLEVDGVFLYFWMYLGCA